VINQNLQAALERSHDNITSQVFVFLARAYGTGCHPVLQVIEGWVIVRRSYGLDVSSRLKCLDFYCEFDYFHSKKFNGVWRKHQ